MGASKKIQIAYLELYPLESGKAYGLVRHRAHYGTRRPHAKDIMLTDWNVYTGSWYSRIH